ncbi:MAG: DNA methyltransferase, partial [Bacteroidota bacterium]
ILYFTKSENYVSNKLFLPHSKEYIKSKFTQEDERGLYQLQPLKTVSDEKLAKLRQQNRVVEQEGKYLRYKQYLSDSKGKPVNDIWTDVHSVNSQALERVNYATQKPEALLERIIKASSNEGDLVLDCFCGSGTTAATTEKLGRRWITADLGRFSIHTTRKRLLGIEHVKPFIVQNLGKYERQQWMEAEFDHPENRLAQLNAYRSFILDLYHANALAGYTWLHGAKAGRMVHVGGVSSPVTVEDIKASIKEFWQLAGKERNAQTNGIDFLGWDFAFEVNETAQHMAAENKVNIRCLKIPREVLEKQAVEQGDIVFYELAYLDAKTSIKGKNVGLTLNNFVISPDEVPQEVQQSITHWSQWIDYWAVDWNYQGYGDTFHNEWQSYRTKQRPKLELQASHVYEEAGTYQVLVKVIDILGNDTTKIVEIEVGG